MEDDNLVSGRTGDDCWHRVFVQPRFTQLMRDILGRPADVVLLHLKRHKRRCSVVRLSDKFRLSGQRLMLFLLRICSTRGVCRAQTVGLTVVGSLLKRNSVATVDLFPMTRSGGTILEEGLPKQLVWQLEALRLQSFLMSGRSVFVDGRLPNDNSRLRSSEGTGEYVVARLPIDCPWRAKEAFRSAGEVLQRGGVMLSQLGKARGGVGA